MIHTEKLRWLVWLRWKLLLRGFRRNNGRLSNIIGSVILLLVSLVVGGGLGVATFFGYHLPAPFNSEILTLVLSGIYLLWLAAPLMQASTNEGLDVSKLELFPLTRAELMISLLFSTLLDTSTLFIVLMFGAVVAGWATSLPMALMALLTMLIFYVQIIGISQLVIALLSRVLHSRRLRDLSVILVVLISASCSLSQFVIRGAINAGFVDALRNDVFAQYLQWLPPGMAARAIQQASLGNWGISFAWLGALLVLSLLALYLWQVVMVRALTAAESGSTVRVRQRVERSTRAAAAPIAGAPGQAGLLGRLLASQPVAIAMKDLKYFRRDPQLSALLLQSLISVVVFIMAVLVNGKGGPSPWMVMAAPAFITLSLYTLSYNMLGMERQALTTLFLLPVEPKRILWGKNLVIAVIGLIEIIAVILLSAVLSRGWEYVLPSFAVGVAALGTILAFGNFTSVFLPQRMRLARRGFQTTQTSAEAGCLRSLMSILTLLVMYIVLLPVAAALVLPVLFHAQWVWIASIPLSLAYGCVLYSIVTGLVAPRLLAKAPEILALVTKE